MLTCEIRATLVLVAFARGRFYGQASILHLRLDALDWRSRRMGPIVPAVSGSTVSTKYV